MEPSIAEPPDVVLRVEGMMCMKNCGTTVQNALRTSSSVKQAIVSFEEGVARVWWQEGKQGDVKSLVESVESVGFDASLLHPSPSPSSSSTTTIPNHPPLAPPSCRGKGGGEAGKEEEEEGGPDYVLEIEGMMCMKSCGTTVQNALRALPGVRLAIVTYPEAMARVWQTKQSNLQGGVEGVKVDATLLIDAVEGVGFGAKLVAGPGERRLNLFRREGGREGGKEGGSPNPAGSSFSVSPRRQALPSLSSPSSAFSNSPGVCRPRGGGRREGGKVMQVVTGRGGGGGAVGAADLAPSVYTHKGHFEIRGMSCAACVGHVERAVMDNVPGVRWVKVALLTEKAEVLFAPSLGASPKGICEAVEATGGYSCRHLRTDVAGEGRGGRFSGEVYTLSIHGMSCAACSGKIEREVGKMEGVEACVVSLSTQLAKVSLYQEASSPTRRGHAPSIGIRDVLYKIEALGFTPTLVQGEGGGGIEALQKSQKQETAEWWRLFCVAVLLSGPMMLTMWTAPSSLLASLHAPWVCYGRVNKMSLISFMTTTPVQIYVGRRFYRNAWKGLRHRNYGMDLLVALGTSTAYFYSLFAMCLACTAPPSHSEVGHMDAGMEGGMEGEMHHHAHLFFFDTAAMLLTFVSLGETSQALTVLASLQPKSALLLPHYPPLPHDEGGGEGGREEACELELALVKPGDVLRVLPGASVPTDGVVVEGKSYVNESMLTGEVIPVAKTLGDDVLGGTLNQHGAFLMRATSVGRDTALSQILALVQEAQLSKPPIQRFADRLASLFTPCVMLLATVVSAAWLAAGLCGWIPSSYLSRADETPVTFALTIWISVITVACPCALGLATPTAVMVGTGVGARLGILIKGGDAFQAACDVTAVVFDKTGTLTTGKAVVTDEVPVASLLPEEGKEEGNAERPSQEEEEEKQARKRLLALAAAVETGSEHPVAQAVLRHAKGQGLYIPHASSFEITPGLGVTAQVEGMGRVAVGNARFLEEAEGLSLSSLLSSLPTYPPPSLPPSLPESSNDDGYGSGNGRSSRLGGRAGGRKGRRRSVADARRALEARGKTVVFVTAEGRLQGLLAVSDKPRPEATRTVAALQRMGIEVWMLTGDSSAAAEAVAQGMGIRHVQAGTLPGQKAKRVQALQAQGHRVCMVGDGINDSPALAQADVGVAIGAGAQVACEAADLVLLHNSLSDVVTALHLARTVFRRIQLNMLWALGYNVIGIPLAAGAFLPSVGWRLPPGYSGLAMIMSSLSVVVSSLALRMYRRPDLDTIGRTRSLHSLRHGTREGGREREASQLQPLVLGENGGDEGGDEEEGGARRGRQQGHWRMDTNGLVGSPSLSLASERARASMTHRATSQLSRVSRLWQRLRGYSQLEEEGAGREGEDKGGGLGGLSSLERREGEEGGRGGGRSIMMIQLGREGNSGGGHRDSV